jgi:eukaryotic-like serine/threonine-protein kinase
MTEPVFPLSDYEIGELIGQGQFGEVRRAHWTPRGIEVALKKIAASASDAVNKIKAEQRGAELQLRLGTSHQGLVPELYQDGLDANGDYYIAMERIAGQSLADVIKTAPRPSRETAQMGLALADFLRRLHTTPESDHTAEPIIHSDLKPDHVLVLPDGSIRVLDLGIAKTLRANRALTVNFWASAPYASPERLEDGSVRLGDDLWAVGVMLFEMACREHPYQAYMVDDNNAALARAIRRSEPQGAIHRDCDEPLAAIIRKMLAPQPSHRYQTADDVAADLTRYLDGEAPLAAAESARASSATQVVPAPTARQFRPLDTVPTDPVPPELLQAADAAPEPARLAPWRRFAFKVPRLPGKLRAVAAVIVMMIILAQAAAWVRTERLRDRLGRVEATDIERLRTDIRRIQANAPFPSALSGRLQRAVTERMLLIADRPIHDYRQDLFVSQLQWQEAQRSLALAAEFDEWDSRLAAKTALVDAHLTRISAQERGLAARDRQKRLTAAMSRFIESGRFDSSSPDPYIGQARINAYDLHDFDALVANLAEADKRGFTPGRRERTQLGDTLRFRADRAIEQAVRAPIDDRRRLLGQASADYEACAGKFDGLTGYHDAEKVLAYCQGRRAAVQRLLQQMDELDELPKPGVPDASSDR